MKIHIVQKGDTIWEIAAQYGVNFEELKKLNSHLSSPDMIMPGMKIKIPTTSKYVKTSPTSDKIEKKETTKKESPKVATKTDIQKDSDQKKSKEVTDNYTLQQLKKPQLGDETLTTQSKNMFSKQVKQPESGHEIKQQSNVMPSQQYDKSIKQQMPGYDNQHFPGFMPLPNYVNPMPVQPCCCHCHCKMPYQMQLYHGNMHQKHNVNMQNNMPNKMMNEKHIFNHHNH